jgi:nucleotide-binding universal stress UspA family protein
MNVDRREPRATSREAGPARVCQYLADARDAAWNAGREALRAVHDAMPLLERAKKVTLFAFASRPSALRKSAQALADHLAAHGVKTEHIRTNTGDLTAIEALFASLDTQDADLIVAGAYGHSRLYEGLFGGVTMDLMHQQSLPVLMSH